MRAAGFCKSRSCCEILADPGVSHADPGVQKDGFMQACIARGTRYWWGHIYSRANGAVCKLLRHFVAVHPCSNATESAVDLKCTHPSAKFRRNPQIIDARRMMRVKRGISPIAHSSFTAVTSSPTLISSVSQGVECDCTGVKDRMKGENTMSLTFTDGETLLPPVKSRPTLLGREGTPIVSCQDPAWRTAMNGIDPNSPWSSQSFVKLVQNMHLYVCCWPPARISTPLVLSTPPFLSSLEIPVIRATSRF